jgi:glycosyltransferase 2 family protein
LNSNQFQYGIKIVGYLLCAISIWLLADIFFAHYKNIEHVHIDSKALFVFIFGAVVIVIGHINIVIGWYLQLKNKYPYISFKQSYIAIGVSQIAKYLPGNVAHFIGRAILVKDIDSKADITYAMLIETIILSLTALLFASLWSALYYLPAEVNAISIVIITILFCVGTVIIVEVLKRKLNANWISYNTLFYMLALNSLSFFLHGYVIYLIASLFSDIPSLSILQYTLGFSAAFLVGYLLPGAPGGIGVREYAFILLFGTFIGKGIALEVIVIHRLVAIVGDVLFLLSAYLLKLDTK